MKALISPNEAPISYISSWKAGTPPTPIVSKYPNSCRVAQVEPDDQTFPVAEPMFWTTCPNNCVADQWYYDTANQTINPIVNAPIPAADNQPATTGTTQA
jgi:hypothetical protein